ncbi:hypothetical protein GCM10022408_07010 [Hymenobacter fastidiosus]|uniref:Lipoprotein n=1 Tax=Hymenobacter fastidiosus TaxID=486264 RepID=A0ABP7RKG8_9BACT
MNNRSLFSRLVLLLMLPVLLSYCSRAKQEDPKPKEYAVRVQVTGSKMAGVGGSAVITSTRDYAGVTGAPVENLPILRVYSVNETTINESFDLGKFGAADRIRARVEMNGYGSEPVLRADILVNGVVKKSCFVKGGGVFSVCELVTDSL